MKTPFTIPVTVKNLLCGEQLPNNFVFFQKIYHNQKTSNMYDLNWKYIWKESSSKSPEAVRPAVVVQTQPPGELEPGLHYRLEPHLSCHLPAVGRPPTSVALSLLWSFSWPVIHASSLPWLGDMERRAIQIYAFFSRVNNMLTTRRQYVVCMLLMCWLRVDFSDVNNRLTTR